MKKERKILKFGTQAIAVKHFTTDITSLPFIMDSNCFITFSLLWRMYDSHSLNKNLITDDGWFQYTMKSLMTHCGFKDKGTLQRTVEGLYRSGIIDVRVESGSRLWACWKLNKELIEKIASLTDRDSMDEPFLKSIRTIESKDKEYTYLNNKEGINELMKFFSAKAEEKKRTSAEKELHDKELKSPEWKKKRREVFDRYGEQCAECGRTEKLQVHHLCYRKGHHLWEYDVSELIPLCGKCHRKISKDKNHIWHEKYIN